MYKLTGLLPLAHNAKHSPSIYYNRQISEWGLSSAVLLSQKRYKTCIFYTDVMF